MSPYGFSLFLKQFYYYSVEGDTALLHASRDREWKGPTEYGVNTGGIFSSAPTVEES